MTASEAIAVVLQLATLFPTLEPAFVKAVQDFKAMFSSGAEPTQADIDALIQRIQEQSAQIQAIAQKDAAAN